MDPNLFAIDTERLFEALIGVIILSMLVERALAFVFENRRLVSRLSGSGTKELISFAVAVAVCRFWDFDVISVIFVKESTQLWGHVMTAAIVAGGSKGSIKLFHDVFDMMSSAERERQAFVKARLEAVRRGEVPPAAPVPVPVPAPAAAPAPAAGGE